MTIQPKTLGCVKKWLMLYSLKFQRDNRKKALAVDPAKGKTGKKAVFSPHCGDETTTYYNRAFALWPAAGASAFLLFFEGRAIRKWLVLSQNSKGVTNKMAVL